jgi:hypothetical protein
MTSEKRGGFKYSHQNDQFWNKIKNLPQVGQKWLIPANIHEAANWIIKVDKAHHFQMEIDYIEKGKPVLETSKLASRSPTLDTH